MDKSKIEAIRERLETYEGRKFAWDEHQQRYGTHGSVSRKLEDQAMVAWIACCVDNGKESQRELLNTVDELEAESGKLRDCVMDMEADIRSALVLIEDILDDDISALARSDVLALKGHLEDLVPDSLACSICGAPAKYIANNERRCNEHKRVESGE